MKPTLIAALSVVLMMSGCERSQVNYDTPKVLPSEYTSEELVWQGLGIVAMILAVGALSDTDRDALGL
jgi:hypothetical protein